MGGKEVDAMSDELEQLKDDLAKLLEAAKIYDARYKGADWKAVLGIIEPRIARLEAEADPWRDVKADLETWRKTTRHEGTRRHIAFYDHLTAENAKLAARVAELEAEAKAEDDADVADAESVISDPKTRYTNWEEAARAAWAKNVAFRPPFEGPIVGLDPILDPAKPGEDRTVFDSASCDRLIAWFGALEDTRREFLEAHDYKLAKAIYDSCGRTVPGSVLKGCGLTDAHAAKPRDDDPILDPARVLATAANIMSNRGFYSTANTILRQSKDAKPYRLKGDENGS